MKALRVYTGPGGETVLHTSGFSMTAGFLPMLWALQRRWHGFVIIGFIYDLALGFAGTLLGDSYLIFFVAQFLVVGAAVNPLHAWWLRRRGWQPSAVEAGDSLLAPASTS